MGKVIQFNYDGGTHHGGLRTVYVDSEPERGIQNGLDLDKASPRKYHTKGMRNIVTLDSRVVDMASMPKTLGYEAVVTGFKHEGFKVAQNGTVLIAYALRGPKIEFGPFGGGQTGLQVVKEYPGGKQRTLHLVLGPDKKNFIACRYNYLSAEPPIRDCTPEQLIECIRWVLDA